VGALLMLVAVAVLIFSMIWDYANTG